MKLTFYGAAREVTGSCFLLETNRKKILIDCGMFQGSKFNQEKNNEPFEFSVKEIDAVLVTHAHLDHSGKIPKLIRDGFDGPIYATRGTCDFMRLIWEDALKIMTDNNRKYGTSILYNQKDINKAISRVECVNYHQEIMLENGVKAVWKDAGHIFGAGFIELEAENKKIVFSGDIGNENVPILKDTEPIDNANIVLCESTYGDRIHESVDTRRSIILNLIKKGLKRGGTIMIPAFSLERTQELLYELNLLIEHDKRLPNIPIFLDSPLAIKATAVYKKYPQYYDEEAAQLHMIGDDFLHFPMLKKTLTVAESKKINDVHGSKIIIAGSGMMTGGRILHHASRYLPDPKSTLLIVGYQAEGTLGRRLYEGTKKVKIFGEDIAVRCNIKAVGALSAHGDQKKLINWNSTSKESLEQIFCVHGEPNAVTTLAHKIKDDLKIKTFVPGKNETVNL